MPKTLLLVDDSVTIQRVVELTFAHEDVRIVSMSDGQRALQWLEVDKPDIVVVDVGVPEVDGYTVASRVKASKRHKNVPILLLAGAFEPVDEARLREIGCDGVIVKPFEPKQLVERVKELIDLTPARATPRPASAPEPVHGAPSIPSAAAAMVNPAPLRAVRSMPPPPPPPGEKPVSAPAATAAAVSDPPIAAKVSSMPVPPAAPAAVSANSSVAVATPPATTTPSASVDAPASMSAAVSPFSTVETSTPPSMAIARPPQPLELPNRPMWQASGGSSPTPVSVSPTPLSAPASSAKAALVNAFSALLAVDPPAPPPPPPAPAPAPTVAVVSENMIEAAVRRVLEQMTGEHVRKVVAETAERLVREEIERIKENPE
jgi:CheY-like chemotaxis protein